MYELLTSIAHTRIYEIACQLWKDQWKSLNPTASIASTTTIRSLYRVVRVVRTISRETDLRLIAICRTRAEAKALVEELKS